MSIYPMRLSGVTRSPIWGGTRLPMEWHRGAVGETVGESWELTVRRDGECRVTNGEYAGMPLREVIARARDGVLGESRGDADAFPLLIKLIDAADRLSVQVHPDDDYAARVENDRGKTEMWYIVAAEEGAEIICGLNPDTDTAAFAAAVAAGNTEAALCHVPVHAGECYFIPAGLPHAIGRGILIAEIQQNCDLTYRVYDYDRVDKNGCPRELHVKKALDVIRPFTGEEIERLRFSRGRECATGTLLADCEYFRVSLLSPDKAACTLSGGGRMGHLLCLAGEGELVANGEVLSLARGDSILLPAALSEVTVSGDCSVLYSEAY